MEGMLIFAELEHYRETSSKQNQSKHSECIQSTIVWVQSTTCETQIVNCQKNANCKIQYKYKNAKSKNPKCKKHNQSVSVSAQNVLQMHWKTMGQLCNAKQ